MSEGKGEEGLRGALEPCPFCGSLGEEVGLTCNPNPPPADGRAEWGVQRYVCHVASPYYDTRAEVVAAWNARAPSALTEAEGYWLAHSGEDYSVVMRPDETTDSASIQLSCRNPNLAAHIAITLNAKLAAIAPSLTQGAKGAREEALERLEATGRYWVIAKGTLRSDEPLYAVQIMDGQTTDVEAETEAESLEEALSDALALLPEARLAEVEGERS